MLFVNYTESRTTFCFLLVCSYICVQFWKMNVWHINMWKRKTAWFTVNMTELEVCHCLITLKWSHLHIWIQFDQRAFEQQCNLLLCLFKPNVIHILCQFKHLKHELGKNKTLGLQKLLATLPMWPQICLLKQRWKAYIITGEESSVILSFIFCKVEGL